MTIPQSDQPLFDVEVLSRKKTYKFRPFLVKEEKILVLATQSEDPLDLVKAIQQVITNCSFGEVQGDEIPIFDLQKIFMSLRSQSISSKFTVNFVCGFCESSHPEEIDMSDFQITENSEHENPVKINDEKYVKMGYPSAEDLMSIGKAEEVMDIYDAAANCLEEIHTKDDVIDCKDFSHEERIDMIESMTLIEFGNIKKFFETMPVLEKEVTFTCQNGECRRTSSFYMNGYLDFFV